MTSLKGELNYRKDILGRFALPVVFTINGDKRRVEAKKLLRKLLK